jgi:hypothetical protein
MEDKTPIVGIVGSIASLTLAQWSDVFALAAGILTCVYLIAKLVLLARKR